MGTASGTLLNVLESALVCYRRLQQDRRNHPSVPSLREDKGSDLLGLSRQERIPDGALLWDS